MATQAGIGILLGLGIGSGVTAFFMQRIIRRQDNALQQSLNRLNRIQEDHAQDLNAALEKMSADYEQQLAAKIERYQDTHEEQLNELEAEYEARIAALTNHGLLPEPDTLSESEAEDAATPVEAPPVESDSASSFTPIPDPWTAPSNAPVDASELEAIADHKASPEPESEATPDPTAPPETEAAPSTPAVSIPDQPASSTRPAEELTKKATELGKAAATNRKEAIRAVPKLGQLVKDNDADVRLAAVTALHECGSIKAIPFLRKALRDPDNRIVAAASMALSRFKGTKKLVTKVKKRQQKRRR